VNTKKVRVYKEYHSVCPLVGIRTLPTPLSPASVPLPPEPLTSLGGGGGDLGLKRCFEVIGGVGEAVHAVPQKGRGWHQKWEGALGGGGGGGWCCWTIHFMRLMAGYGNKSFVCAGGRKSSLK
jgi:hypothetical protein